MPASARFRRSVMGRALVDQTGGVGIAARHAAAALAQQAQLGEDAVELARHVQHGLVLLGHVALEPSEAFFEAVNAFV